MYIYFHEDNLKLGVTSLMQTKLPSHENANTFTVPLSNSNQSPHESPDHNPRERIKLSCSTLFSSITVSKCLNPSIWFNLSLLPVMFSLSSHAKPTRRFCKLIPVSGLIFYVIYNFSNIHSSSLVNNLIYNHLQHPKTFSPTNITHLVFGIASSSNTWAKRRHSIESWWQPNVTRGFLFLDRAHREFFPWSPSSPPLRISEDTSRYKMDSE